MILHAGLIARRSSGHWRGVLIEGASGSGKSDLALRALERGWSLVADDRTLIWRYGCRHWGRAPDTLAGLIEARGLGIVAADRLPFAEIALVVRCAPAADLERMPELAAWSALGVPACRSSRSPRSKVRDRKARPAPSSSAGLKGQSAYQAPRAGPEFAGCGRGPVRFPK